MKTGKTLALTLGLAAGAVLAVLASKSTKKTKQQIVRKNADVLRSDDNDMYYI